MISLEETYGDGNLQTSCRKVTGPACEIRMNDGNIRGWSGFFEGTAQTHKAQTHKQLVHERS